MVLKEFLIFEAISSTSNHANIQCLDQYLHSHNRMGVCAVQNQHGLYAILIYQARQLEKEQRKHIKPHKQL